MKRRLSNFMAKCPLCGQGINSTYIRVGEKSLLKKVGYYCSICDIPFNKEQKPYTVNRVENGQNIVPLNKMRSLGWDLDPGPLPYQGNALPG
jgi:hypothetical protein